VCWRTYWKGYLAAQPALWSSFRESAARLEKEAAEAPWRATYEAALAGATSLACFNDWVAELQQTGYLHNHARMWFASTWIFTMKLPWELGALFMYRHLLPSRGAGWAGCRPLENTMLPVPTTSRSTPVGDGAPSRGNSTNRPRHCGTMVSHGPRQSSRRPVPWLIQSGQRPFCCMTKTAGPFLLPGMGCRRCAVS